MNSPGRDLLTRALLASCLWLLFSTTGNAADIALVGGTLIDVDHFGASAHDLPDATVLLHDRVISAVGARNAVAVPAGAKIVDVRGRYLIPGLIDGFAAQRSQAQANAHLAMGVTTIVGLTDDRRGLLMRGQPEPHVKVLEQVDGYDQSGLDPPAQTVGELRARARRLSEAELSAYVDAKAWDGVAVLLLMYPLELEQVNAIVAAARRHGLATIGELGHASYVAAARAGVQAFVHLNRIASELAPPDLRRAIADDPFPANSSPLRLRFETFLSQLTATQPDMAGYATEIAGAGAALMPTTTLFVAGTSLSAHNPWNSPIGPLIDPHDVHAPLERSTGSQPLYMRMPPAARAASLRGSRALLDSQAAFVKVGVHYLAASGTTAFGVLPGDGLHWEMQLLTQLGLTARQALAAATANYSAIFGWTDRGLIAPGRLADLVVLRDDPSVAIERSSSIERVYLAGEEIDRSRLLHPDP